MPQFGQREGYNSRAQRRSDNVLAYAGMIAEHAINISYNIKGMPGHGTPYGLNKARRWQSPPQLTSLSF
jgi:hypothetical protein